MNNNTNMKIIKFQEQSDWMNARRTKITGSRLVDVVVLRGTTEKKAFWELVAERLAKPRKEGEKPMERGHELEQIAVELCEKELGKTFNKDLVMWERDDDECIAISPDAYAEDLKEAVEVKCLNSADHIKALVNKGYPEEYRFQIYQYFIVNPELEKLQFVMYDPSFLEKFQYIRFEITREEVQDKVDEYLEYQRKTLERINKIVNEISF